MASHAYITTPLLPAKASRPPGPVTLAIQAIQSGHGPTQAEVTQMMADLAHLPSPSAQEYEREVTIMEMRRRLEERIEADLALLDELDGDPDLEPSLGAPDPHTFGGMLIERLGGVVRPGDQERWADGGLADRELDVGDEPEGGTAVEWCRRGAHYFGCPA